MSVESGWDRIEEPPAVVRGMECFIEGSLCHQFFLDVWIGDVVALSDHVQSRYKLKF